jgi:thioredoxin-like negative regulator of GroEL
MPKRAQIEEMLKSDPDDVFLLYARAMACVGEGDLEAALAGFDDVIRRDPRHVPARFQKGRALAEAGRTEEAAEVLTAGITVARQTGDAHAEREMREFLDLL